MNNLIDFNECRTFLNDYEGADTKLKIQFNNEIYMLKLGKELEHDDKKPLQASHSNTPVAEYLGSHIFQMMGIPAQKTLLGSFNGRLAVACRDFVSNRSDASNVKLTEFKKLETSFLNGSSAVTKTPIYESILDVFQNHPYLEPIRQQAIDRYWQTFAIDALIGNFDRHAGNWGYFYDIEQDRLFDLAPVYDCGSTFYPMLSQQGMIDLIANHNAFVERTMLFPNAALRMNGSKKKVSYHEFLKSPEGKECRKFLPQLYEKLDLGKIHELIESTPGIGDVQREFYSLYIDTRDKEIMQPALEMALEENRDRNDIGLERFCELSREASRARANSCHDVLDNSLER